MIIALLAILAYLVGSIPSAVIVSRLMGLPDPRSIGSGNPGATNVLRTGSKSAAAITLIADIAKGLIPVLCARALSADPRLWAAAGIAAFLGHLYPLFLKFRGGKGVATALGVTLAVGSALGLALAASWIVIALVFRYSSLAALTTAVLAPLYAWLLLGQPALIAMSAVLTVLLIWRHRANLARLVAGTEPRIGHRPA